MNRALAAAFAKAPKRSKYGNRKTPVGEVMFDSAKEAKRFGELKLLERAGKITDLKLQPKFPCYVNDQLVCVYRGDFAYVENGSPVVEDVKGYRTKEYLLKRKLVAACHGFDIREV